MDERMAASEPNVYYPSGIETLPVNIYYPPSHEWSEMVRNPVTGHLEETADSKTRGSAGPLHPDLRYAAGRSLTFEPESIEETKDIPAGFTARKGNRRPPKKMAEGGSVTDLSHAYEEVKTLPSEALQAEAHKANGLIPSWLAMSELHARQGMGSSFAGGGVVFQSKAPMVVQRLMQDLGITREQAAGIVGSLGHESGGFTQMQELNPTSGRGGLGWGQWTGPRRTEFENYAKQNNLSTSSDEANYGNLIRELKGPEAAGLNAVRQTNNVTDATKNFTQVFERPGVMALNSRLNYANQALGGSAAQAGMQVGAEVASQAAAQTGIAGALGQQAQTAQAAEADPMGGLASLMMMQMMTPQQQAPAPAVGGSAPQQKPSFDYRVATDNTSQTPSQKRRRIQHQYLDYLTG